MEKLYKDIGGKIKRLAMGIFITEAIAAVIYGLTIIFLNCRATLNAGAIISGLIVVVLGPIVAFVSSWLLYAIGEIVDYLSLIEENTSGFYKGNTPLPVVTKPVKKNNEAVKQTAQTKSDALPKMSADDDSFEVQVMNMSADDLTLILQDQRDLYSKEEIEFITSVYNWKSRK